MPLQRDVPVILGGELYRSPNHYAEAGLRKRPVRKRSLIQRSGSARLSGGAVRGSGQCGRLALQPIRATVMSQASGVSCPRNHLCRTKRLSR
jgi:hypothetical protein